MKLFKLAVASLVLATTMYAAGTQKQEQLRMDMRTMLAALEKIQKAGFYNNAQGMKSGVMMLKSGLHSLTTTDAKSYLPDEKAVADKFAQKRARMIKMYAEDLVASIEAKNMDDALDDYYNIQKQCSSCHLRIRHY